MKILVVHVSRTVLLYKPFRRNSHLNFDILQNIRSIKKRNIVNLFCAVVGQQGNAFPVDIIASESVGDLKKAIREENEKTITCDSRELELFLAKKGNEWLTKEGVAAVTVDEHGHPVGFDHMDPLTWIKNPKNYGNIFEPNEG